MMEIVNQMNIAGVFLDASFPTPTNGDSKIKKHFGNTSWNTRVENGKPNSPQDPLPNESMVTSMINSVMPSHFSFSLAT
jgi:hypothetical protein